MPKLPIFGLLSYRYNIYQVRLEFRKLFDILVHPTGASGRGSGGGAQSLVLLVLVVQGSQIGIFINISSSEMQIVCTTALNQLRRNLYFCPTHFSSTDFTSYVFGKWESRVRGN